MNVDKPKVLIVDDDSRILELLKEFFARNGFESYSAIDANEAYEILGNKKVDIMILDVMLPGLTGFEFAKKIKEQSKNTPIILLTALSEPDNRVKGLESGADDYVTKPFDPRELILRVRNLLDLYNINTQAQKEPTVDVVEFGKCTYSFAQKLLKINGEDVLLSSTDQKLLEYFMQNRGRTLSRNELSKLMGGLSDRSVDVQIVRLRQKIEKDAKQPKFLQTIRHEGYGLYI